MRHNSTHETPRSYPIITIPAIHDASLGAANIQLAIYLGALYGLVSSAASIPPVIPPAATPPATTLPAPHPLRILLELHDR